MNYDQLTIDKENADVKFNNELHKYWTKDSNQSCISVTTLINNFTSFDEAFWSAYKTLEKLTTADDFSLVKPDLLQTKRFSDTYLDRFHIPAGEFERERTELLKEWEAKREESCIRGTQIHKAQEMLHLSGETKEIQHLNLGGKFKTNTSNKIEINTKGIYPELLLSRVSPDGKLRIAGQADLVIVDDLDVYILDYKTGKEMEQKSYYDRRNKKHSMMKYPLNNIQDTNFWHYSLQLSTYAWLIQKINPEFNIKLLMLIHFDHKGNVNNYECQYLKKDVERMLAYYKKKIEHDEFSKSIEKIIF